MEARVWWLARVFASPVMFRTGRKVCCLRLSVDLRRHWNHTVLKPFHRIRLTPVAGCAGIGGGERLADNM